MCVNTELHQSQPRSAQLAPFYVGAGLRDVEAVVVVVVTGRRMNFRLFHYFPNHSHTSQWSLMTQ